MRVLFPGRVVQWSPKGVLATPDRPALPVAAPGAQPAYPGGSGHLPAGSAWPPSERSCSAPSRRAAVRWRHRAVSTGMHGMTGDADRRSRAAARRLT